MAEQAGLCLAWSETPEDMFCRVVAHVMTIVSNLELCGFKGMLMAWLFDRYCM